MDCRLAPNVAVTVLTVFTVSVHVLAPVHAPLHPAKVNPASGVAVNVTFAPGGKLALQVVLQLIPAGALVTVPVPAPAVVTVRPRGACPSPWQPERNNAADSAATVRQTFAIDPISLKLSCDTRFGCMVEDPGWLLTSPAWQHSIPLRRKHLRGSSPARLTVPDRCPMKARSGGSGFLRAPSCP